jgi:hypothetical protein
MEQHAPAVGPESAEALASAVSGPFATALDSPVEVSE